MKTEKAQAADHAQALRIAAALLLYPDAVNAYATAHATAEPLELVRVHIVSDTQEILFTRWRLIPLPDERHERTA